MEKFQGFIEDLTLQFALGNSPICNEGYDLFSVGARKTINRLLYTGIIPKTGLDENLTIEQILSNSALYSKITQGIKDETIQKIARILVSLEIKYLRKKEIELKNQKIALGRIAAEKIERSESFTGGFLGTTSDRARWAREAKEKFENFNDKLPSSDVERLKFLNGSDAIYERIGIIRKIIKEFENGLSYGRMKNQITREGFSTTVDLYCTKLSGYLKLIREKDTLLDYLETRYFYPTSSYRYEETILHEHEKNKIQDIFFYMLEVFEAVPLSHQLSEKEAKIKEVVINFLKARNLDKSFIRSSLEKIENIISDSASKKFCPTTGCVKPI